jgi:hypothetical protein
MDPIEEALDKANTSASDDFGFQPALHTMKRQIDGEIQNELLYNIALLESTDAEHPLLEALRGYQRWENDQNYENGAEHALKNYEEGIGQALDDCWFHVASWSLAAYIDLADSLNHEDRLQQAVDDAIELLEEQYSEFDTDEGSAGRILDAISEADLRSIDSATLDRLVEFAWTRAEYTNKQHNYHAQRNYLHRVRQIQEQRDESIEDVQEGLTESYEDEIEFQKTRGHLVTATTIEGALKECESFADEETLNRWRLEKRKENRKGIEQEMKSVGGEVPDEVTENFTSIANTLVENFENAANEFSPEQAFLGLVKVPVFLPHLDDEPSDSGARSEEKEEGENLFPTASLTDIFPRRHMTHEGDSVSSETSDIDVPEWYSAEARLSVVLTARVLYKLINQRLIKEHHFFTLLESIDGTTVDDKAFLTDFIIAFFEDRHAEAVHLGMPRLEGVIKHQLEASGTAITASIRGEDLPKTFGGLMNRLDGLLDEDYVTFLRFRYHDATGEALRNRTAHGELRYKEAHYDFSASLLLEIFRSAVYISELDQE